MNLIKFLFGKKQDKIEDPCEFCPYQVLYKESIDVLASQWHNIDKETVAPISGLYLIECSGDNHIVYEIHEYMVNTLFSEYFTEGSAHMNGWHTVKPLRYLFVPN